MFGLLVRMTEVRRLAPIAVVIETSMYKI